MTGWQQDKLVVQRRYPTAYCSWHTDMLVHKVYHLVGDCRVALGAGCATVAEAWQDAATAVREKFVKVVK